MRSLWSGVSGLQAHQIAMDTESNNIANVNTNGFKYGRASFADMLSQTRNVATAPQGEMGGKNPMQVGLGTSINSIDNIFSQGSVETTDKNTDVAIQGDGFFMVSPDGGDTYKYTRAGDFKFDGDGNFVDNNGYIVQGWTRNEDTKEIETTAAIEDLQIKPGMTTPAQKSSEISLKANLNSGDQVETKSPVYSLKYDANGTGEFDVVDEEGDYIDDPNIQDRINDVGVLFNQNGEALNVKDGEGVWMSYDQAENEQTLAAANTGGGDADMDLDINGVNVTYTVSDGEAPVDYGNGLAAAINAKTSEHGVQATYDGGDLKLINTNENGTTAEKKNIDLVVNDDQGTGLGDANVITAHRYTYDSTGASGLGVYDNTERSFRTTADLLEHMQNDARNNVDYDGDAAAEANPDVEFGLNSEGSLTLRNPDSGGEDMNMTVTGLSSGSVTENEKLSSIFNSISGNLAAGSTGSKISQSMYAATHSASTEVYDSLGTKHTVKIDFMKASSTSGGGSQWDMEISIPKPASIAGENAPFTNKITNGSISFDNSGSIASMTPSSFTFSPNNGAEPDQSVQLDFGGGGYDGLTSFNKESSTGGISQDGYAGGDLLDIRIDQSGTLIGSFSNGRSFGLAQLAMAKFSNNQGLSNDGDNMYVQSANSGDPIVGTAATGGKGFIQSSALEMSNVDLSRSLTKLITVQRGFQANSKTITTSDQMLNTLLGLKQ